jgi:iron complex transport system ATP-binding protein
VIDGVEVTVGPEAVVVTARRPLAVASTAVTGGGLTAARSIVNLHVPKDYPWQEGDTVLGDFVRARAVPGPWVGLLTSAWTEKAEIAAAAGDEVTALAVVTVGLGNPVAAGISPAAPPSAGTINVIVVVEAKADPAALVNAALTVTEVKTMALMMAGVRCPDGALATGTSTDAVVVAATGRGARRRFGGPISDLGWAVARAAHAALTAGVRRWLEEHA